MAKRRNIKYDEGYLLYLEGLSLEQVATKLNVTRQCVFKAFKKRGFTLRGPNFKPVQVYNDIKFTLKPSGYYAATTGKRKLMHRYVWEHEVGPIPKDYDIHHINNIKGDNRLENLECLPKSEHTRKYSPHNNQYTKGRVVIK